MSDMDVRKSSNIDIDQIKADVNQIKSDTNQIQSDLSVLSNLCQTLASQLSVNTLQANIGNFQSQTNLKTLLQSLGIPDVALKSLYTCLISDRLDNATFGLNAIKTLIGSTSDDEAINSLYGILYILKHHIHSDTFLYPSNTVSTLIQKAANAWPAFPTPTEFIPANTITSPFDLHFISFTGVSATGEYEIGIFEGLAGAEILRNRIPISRTAVQAQEGRFPVMTRLFSANTRISCALTGSPVAVESVRVKLTGHSY